MILYGHNGAVTCLDLHGDKFVSGAKDHLVKGAVVLPVHLCPDVDRPEIRTETRLMV